MSFKKLLTCRFLANVVVTLLFLLVYFASARVLVEVQVIGEVKMQGLSQLGTQVFRIACLAGAVLSLFSFRASPLFVGLLVGILAHMGIGVYQDVSDLAEYYPNIDSVINSIEFTGWGKVLSGCLAGLILQALFQALQAVCKALTFAKKGDLPSAPKIS